MKTAFALAGVFLAAALAPAASAQDYGGSSPSATRTANTSPIQLGADVDVLNVNKLPGATLGYGVRGSTPLSDDVSAGLSLDYWSGADNGLQVPLNANDLILGAFTRANISGTTLPFMPVVLGGVDVHRISHKGGTQANLGPTGNEYTTDTRLGLNAGAGANFPITNDFSAEALLRYRYIFGNADVRYNSLGLVGGVTYQM